ncbi:MAG: hypothetical protein LBQ02_00695 [Candidatus Nomurabacteria bacterium]|jgi:uncharacterized protein (DUF2132 family)|nr:hypothetical protein [Candidatus Nomurabacteria bacterium]
MKKATPFNGVEVEYQEFDFSRIINDSASKFFVAYDAKNNVVTVDREAPQRYKELAALHEEICMGHLHQDFYAPSCEEQPDRCLQTEYAILSPLKYIERVDYLRRRIAMFELLVKKEFDQCEKENFKEIIRRLNDALQLEEQLGDGR